MGVVKPHPPNLTMVSHPISISLNSSASSVNSTFLISKAQARSIWTTAASTQLNRMATKIHTWQPSTVTVWLGKWVVQGDHLVLTSPVEADPLIIIPNKALTYSPTSFSTSHQCLQTAIHPRWSSHVAKTSAQEARESDLWVPITRVWACSLRIRARARVTERAVEWPTTSSKRRLDSVLDLYLLLQIQPLLNFSELRGSPPLNTATSVWYEPKKD